MNSITNEQLLMDDLGLDPGDIQRRLQVAGFESDDVSRITMLKPFINHDVDQLVSIFFDHLARQPEAAIMLENQDLVDKARMLKREHLLAMVEGVYDQRYVGQRLRLAQVYGAGRLPQSVFIGAFGRLVEGIGERIMYLEQDKMKAFQGFLAFRRIAAFDVSLIVDTLIHEHEKVIRAQQESIRQLSTPVLQLRDRMLLLPLVGRIDRSRARQMTDDLLSAIRKTRAKAAVIDLTGTAFLDPAVVDRLIQSIQGARIMGCQVILSSISTDVATNLVEQHIALEGVYIVGDLRGGIEIAEQLIPINGLPGAVSLPLSGKNSKSGGIATPVGK